jgi:xanthine dehydrogenase YagS FAD-binding subunit
MEGGTIRSARIGLGGVATVPWRAGDAEALLQGKALTETTARAAAEAAFATAIAHGENAFKIELGKRTLVRALVTAAAMEVHDA